MIIRGGNQSIVLGTLKIRYMVRPLSRPQRDWADVLSVRSQTYLKGRDHLLPPSETSEEICKWLFSVAAKRFLLRSQERDVWPDLWDNLRRRKGYEDAYRAGFEYIYFAIFWAKPHLRQNEQLFYPEVFLRINFSTWGVSRIWSTDENMTELWLVKERWLSYVLFKSIPMVSSEIT